MRSAWAESLFACRKSGIFPGEYLERLVAEIADERSGAALWRGRGCRSGAKGGGEQNRGYQCANHFSPSPIARIAIHAGRTIHPPPLNLRYFFVTAGRFMVGNAPDMRAVGRTGKILHKFI